MNIEKYGDKNTEPIISNENSLSSSTLHDMDKSDTNVKIDSRNK